MLRKIWQGPERRRHQRVEAALDLAVQVELFGFESGAQPFFARGTTLNVSRGGVFAEMDVPVAVGAVSKVFFRDAEAWIEPASVTGRVLRCAQRQGRFQIAIAFDEPLRQLDVTAATRSAVGSR